MEGARVLQDGSAIPPMTAGQGFDDGPRNIGSGMSDSPHPGTRPFAPGGMIRSVVGAILVLAGVGFTNRRRILG